MNYFSDTFVPQDPYQYSVESNWQRLKKILLDLIELYVPSKTINPYKDLPWMNKKIKSQMRKCRKYTTRPHIPNHPLTGLSINLYAML